ncbi:MAG: carbohydrate ABC transporter permease [bacterium]|nr:carbohydrate ABC transporter permease [bacterium]
MKKPRFSLTCRDGGSVLARAAIYILLAFFMITVIYPIYYLFMKSFSTYGGLAVSTDPFMLTPKGFTLDAYTRFFTQSYIHSGFAVTIFRSVVGTVLSTVVMALAAYPLSKRDLPGRKLITWFFMINMFFVGGLIPTYLTVKRIGLLNNVWILVLLPLCSTYYILLLRSFFEGIPEALEEAADIDGATTTQIFFQVILPISIPSLMTIATWQFFTHWNSYFDSMVYITDTSKQVVQVHIRRLVIEQSNMLLAGTVVHGGKADMPTEESMRAAGIMITIIPVLIVYPFVRKYFSKGMVLGAVKG